MLRISLFATLVAVALAYAQGPAKDDVPAASRIQPDELVTALKASGAQTPAILYVVAKPFYI